MSFFNDRLFIPALFGVRIKLRCVLECSLNVDHFRCLNFSIWSILAPSTVKKTQGQGKWKFTFKRGKFEKKKPTKILVFKFLEDKNT